jgi:Type IV secretion-system coupling protein DNA-binding domain
MVELIVLLVFGGLLLIEGVLVLRYRDARRWRRELVAYALRFPRGMQPAAVTAFIAGLSGIVAPRRKRPFVIRAVGVEVSADESGIEHHLLLPRSRAQVVLGALRAALPGVVVRLDEDYQAVRPSLAAELALSDRRRLLNIDRTAAVSSTLLANLQPLERGERIVVQWVASPVGPVGVVPPARKRPSKTTLLGPLWDGVMGYEHDPEVVKARRAKQASPLFVAVGRIGVVTKSAGRARGLLLRVLASFHIANAPGVHLRRRSLPGGFVAQGITERRPPLITAPCLLNAAELAALIGFPIGDVALPGLRLGGARQLAPSSDIPTGGRVVARSTFPGGERPLALSVTDSLRHLHVIGPTGSGKSTLLLGLISQDMAAGRGVVVLDPKGDLVSDVLERVPASRTQDVVVLDPTDDSRPVGLNLLTGATEAPELVVDQVVGIFHQLYKAFWGPRTDDILRAALLTLVAEPGMTLCEVPLLLTDPAFRRRLVGRVDDPVALGPFWGWYDGLSGAERTPGHRAGHEQAAGIPAAATAAECARPGDAAARPRPGACRAEDLARAARQGTARRGSRGAAWLARGSPYLAGRAAAGRTCAGRATSDVRLH